MIAQFAAVLRQKIREDMNTITDAMAVGGCKTYDEYQHQCGAIQGLALAERHLLDLATRAEEANNE